MSSVALAVSVIKQFEGCRLAAYLDIVGVPTIGYGETRGVRIGDVWTQAKADSELEKRVAEFMEGLIKDCPQLATLSDNKMAACTSLAYNIGLRGFSTSTVKRKILAGDIQGAADAFLMWNRAGGKVVQGLVNRRKQERLLFLE